FSYLVRYRSRTKYGEPRGTPPGTDTTMSANGHHQTQDQTTTSTPDTMRAIVQHRYGNADRLHLGEVAVPQIEDEEVLVRVHAAGLDRGTWHLMTGRPYVMRL